MGKVIIIKELGDNPIIGDCDNDTWCVVVIGGKPYFRDELHYCSDLIDDRCYNLSCRLKRVVKGSFWFEVPVVNKYRYYHSKKYKSYKKDRQYYQQILWECTILFGLIVQNVIQNMIFSQRVATAY
jgi:hypothetical protein